MSAAAERVAIKEVAALAGVSEGAVSLAFNGRPGGSERTSGARPRRPGRRYATERMAGAERGPWP